MKRILAGLLSLSVVISSRAYTPNDSLKTVDADGTRADLDAALTYVDGKNQHYWIITNGAAGSSHTWTEKPSFPDTLTHIVTIIGGGGSLTPGSTVGARSDAPTITANHGTFNAISFRAKNGRWVRWTNFKFTQTGSITAFMGIDPPTSSTESVTNGFRVDHCTFTDTGGRAIHVLDANQLCGAVFGLIDHCHFIDTATGGSQNGIYIFGGGNASGWDGDMTWGTVATVTIENCDFGHSGTTVDGNPAIDSTDYGVRWMARYCRATNWVYVFHSDDTGTESTLQVEFAHNYGTVDTVVDTHLRCRGGCVVATDNDITRSGSGGYNSAFKLVNDGSAAMRIGKGAVGGVSTLIGAYFWNNRVTGASTIISGVSGLVLNTDYFDSAPASGTPMTSWTELEYPHPLIAETEANGASQPDVTFTPGVLRLGIKIGP